MIEEGIYLNLSNDEYHGDKESISRSRLMDMKKSARNYWAKHINPERPPRESKAAWDFGTAFHTLILEPHLFNEQFFVLPQKVLLKDVGRTLYDEYKAIEAQAERTSKKVLSLEDYQDLQRMRDSLFNNERARSLIEGGIYESSYFWRDEASGLILKARPDILHDNMYIDLKTIGDASPQNYQREMAAYAYHNQAAMVRDGVFKVTGRQLQACINLCVEVSYPYSVGIYIIDEEAIKHGQNENNKLLLDLSACLRDNSWPDHEIETIGLPRWAI